MRLENGNDGNSPNDTNKDDKIIQNGDDDRDEEDGGNDAFF